MLACIYCRQASLAHFSLLHHLISYAQKAVPKLKTLPSGPMGCKYLARLYSLHGGARFLQAEEKWSKGASKLCQYQSASWKAKHTPRTDGFLPRLCIVCLPFLQPSLSLIFPENIPITPKSPLLHGLLIQSIFQFHNSCKLLAGVWVLLQLIPSLCSSLLVSKSLLQTGSRVHIDTTYLIKLLGRKPRGKISALKKQISPEQTKSFDEPWKDSEERICSW